MKIKVTGISFAQHPEGMTCAYRYSKIDDNGNVVSSNNRGSFVDDSTETAEFLSSVEKNILQRIGGYEK